MAVACSWISRVRIHEERSSFPFDLLSVLGLTDRQLYFEGFTMNEIERIVDDEEVFIMFTDFDMRIKVVNEAYLKFIGKTRAEVKSKKCHDLYNSGVCEPCPFLFSNLFGREVTAKRKFRDDRVLEFHILPLFDEDGVFLGAWHVGRFVEDGKGFLECDGLPPPA